jgi:hypothetical protein
MNDYEKFNRAMDKLLKADPKVIKDKMDEEKRERETRRVAKKSKDGIKK